MKMLVMAALLLLPQEVTIAPKVTHEKHQQVQEYDEVKRECPTGYEGHYVDQASGFDAAYGLFSLNGSTVYAICFKKEFMDEIRKNPDLLTARPQVHGV